MNNTSKNHDPACGDNEIHAVAVEANAKNKEALRMLNKAFGFMMLFAAAATSSWVFDAVENLWRDPGNVALVKCVAAFTEGGTVVSLDRGQKILLPDYFPICLGIVFCLTVLHVVSLMIKTCIEGACALLAEEGMAHVYRAKAGLKYYFKGATRWRKKSATASPIGSVTPGKDC